MPQHAPLYIVASPRPRVGRTLIARLLVEFIRSDNRPLAAYDLDPRDPMLAAQFPSLVTTLDIADTRGQMALFDQLVGGAPRTAVIDLGYGAFERFFTVLAEIGFAEEARRRSVDPVVLFIADTSAATVRTYAELRHGLPTLAFVPVHNESVSVMFERADFPPTRPEYGMIRIPRLSPIVRGVLDRPTFSFGAYMTKRSGGPTEIHSWIASIFAEFRELELRLIMGKLGVSLGAGIGPLREAGQAR